jgi:hypothetical protein
MKRLVTLGGAVALGLALCAPVPAQPPKPMPPKPAPAKLKHDHDHRHHHHHREMREAKELAARLFRLFRGEHFRDILPGRLIIDPE